MATDIYAIVNPGFENGSTGWTLPATTTVETYSNPPEGTHALKFFDVTGPTDIVNTKVPVAAGKRITASAMYQQGAASAGQNSGSVMLFWYDNSGNKVGESQGNVVSSGSGGRWNVSSVSAEAPTGATQVAIGARVIRTKGNESWFDAFQWDHKFTSAAQITSPANGSTYAEGNTVPFRILIDNGGLTATQVNWKANGASIGIQTETPFSLNYSELADGIYDITADVTMSDGTLITVGPVLLNISDTPVPPGTKREFKASNSFTRLILSKLNNVATEIPSISIVTGCKLEIVYSLEVLVRSRDKDIPIEAADPDVAFSILNDGVLEATLLSDNGSEYNIIGSTAVGSIPLGRSEFTSVEQGTSDDFAWNTFATGKKTLVVGQEDSLFGMSDMAVGDFLAASIAIRFYPTLNAVPEQADAGECCVRIRLDSVKAEVYFDAGSVEYYFASSDKVVKGTLVSSNVLNGNLRSGDGEGFMQLAPTLEAMPVSGPYPPEFTPDPNEIATILQDYTIHSHYPPSDNNKIGDVDDDMKYNGLPALHELTSARTKSRYITANFYGDERMNSLFGVNGVGRAYSYNGSEFYKIFTQPEADLDKPRHVAYHHGHLALGYREGRVDVSVVGEPWNFNGVDGASSWGIGDSVTGMISLSGTILGIFGDNSVTGLSGTTVDNFATQIISPRMGAIEYTVVDMGFPVYANSYGIYTLSQTQQYGDYLGSPLSQDISPWLRPRLTTDEKAVASVNIAYPVRSKNQYRLSFTDGYILTMTMNFGQQGTPTFSIHSYGTESASANVFDNGASLGGG